MKQLAATLLILSLLSGLGLPACAEVAATDRAIIISPNEQVELGVGPDGGSKEISRSPARNKLGSDIGTASTQVEELKPVYGPGPKPKLKPDVVVGTLWSDPTNGTRLIVENGYNYPITYQAFLITVRDGKRSYHPTSVCPVRPGLVVVETWPQPVDGVAMTHVQAVDPQHMTCTDGSALSLSAEPPKDHVAYGCGAGQVGAPKPSVSVELTVDSAGSVRAANATWSLATASIMTAPHVFLNYPLEGDVAAPSPNRLGVFVAVGATPQPTAKSASVHVFLNGVEKASRPWRLYGQQLASLRTMDPTKRPIAFMGIIPFVPAEPRSMDDDGLRALLAAVGQDGAELGVRVIGDDGSILGHAEYSAQQTPVHLKSTIDPLLAEALAKAKTPTQCQKLTG